MDNSSAVSRLLTLAASALAAAAWGAEDPAGRALQQHQLQRQQQQDALQLRMQQQQSGAQAAPADARRQQPTDLPQIDQQQRQRQATDRLRIDQQQRQQQLHDRQGIEPGTAQPSEDEAGRRAKAQMELERAQQSGQQQLRRFESEMQSNPTADRDPLPEKN
jgi:hypothetical protein